MRTYLISAMLILSGCLSNDILMSSSTAHKNVENISQLQIGMTQQEVYQIMRYPTSEDQITTAAACYDIWFYITKANILDQSRATSRNLTPLIFKDGIFVGMGREYYSQLVRKIKEPTLPSQETGEQPSDKENIELEKNLAPLPKDQKKSPSKPANDKLKTQKKLSMCSKIKRNPEDSPKASDSKATDDSNKPQLDEEDRRALDLERDENFNDW